MPGMDLSDNELAVLAGKGDAEAYRRLFDRYQHPVYNFVYRMVDNAEDAADIVQDAFIRMYSVLGAREVQNFSAYLYRTAKNLAYDEMRRRSRFVDVDHEVLAPEDPNIYADPQRALLLGEQMQTVRRAAAGLNENQRAALILRELQELDYDQMSEVLESNRNAVGALLSRARLKLREELRMAQIATDQCPPDCEEIIALLSPYIDGELRGGDKERVESHLEGCTFCMAALEEMREASRSFRMFIPVVPPADVAQAFNRQLDEITSQGAGDGQGDSRGHGDDTMDSAQSQAQGGGGIDDATQVMPQGRGGGSGFARLLRRRAPWIAAGAIVLLLATAGMLAWGAGHDDERGARTIPAAGTDTTTISTGSRTQTTIHPTPAVSDPTPQVETTPTTTTSTATTATTPAAGGGTGTSARVTSGYASPNRVAEGQTVAYVSVIQGAAASVTVDLAPQTGGSSISISLKRTSTGSGTETWSASQVAGASGTYYIYVSAIDAQGQYDSLYVGNLTVSPTIY